MNGEKVKHNSEDHIQMKFWSGHSTDWHLSLSLNFESRKTYEEASQRLGLLLEIPSSPGFSLLRFPFTSYLIE